MSISLTQILLCLLAGIGVIVFLTIKFRVHAFFALIIACFVVGFGVGLPFVEILSNIKAGFGRIMQSLGLIIVMGTTLGVLLEHSGSTKVMAEFILKRVGNKRAPMAMSLTGFIVGLPIFCDSGYIVMSGLIHSLAKRTGIPIVILAVSLATGLYAVHCLIPPHPGATAAAVTIGVDFGKLILIGIGVAIPGMIVGYLWAVYAGKKEKPIAVSAEHIEKHVQLPSVMMSFLPVIIPIVLIAINSIFAMENTSGVLEQLFSILGEPVIALAVGILLVLMNMLKLGKQTIGKLLQEGAEKAGSILVIIGAGGAFGAVLAATNIGEHFSRAVNLESLGIWFPFLIAFVLKTAQGSSTVAIITAASIIHPLLPVLGLATEMGQLLCVLAMGAGSMMISHTNDAYFWVISKFSGLEIKQMLRVYSVASIWMGLVTIGVVYLLSLFLLH